MEYQYKTIIDKQESYRCLGVYNTLPQSTIVPWSSPLPQFSHLLSTILHQPLCALIKIQTPGLFPINMFEGREMFSSFQNIVNTIRRYLLSAMTSLHYLSSLLLELSRHLHWRNTSWSVKGQVVPGDEFIYLFTVGLRRVLV